MKTFNNFLKKYNFNIDTIKLFDSFAGIGALHQALNELGVPIELVGISEIDIDAIISYGAVHNVTSNKRINLPSEEEMRQYLMDRNIGYDFKTGKSKIPRLKKDKLIKCYQVCVATNNYGDISKINYKDIEDFDLFNFSFPCTDLSVAGKQEGMSDKEGNKTRSGLCKDGIELIKVKKPKFIMIENVKNLIGKKFIKDFYDITNEIESFGYKCHYPTNDKGQPKALNAKNFGIPQNRERIYVICIRNDVDLDFEFPKEFDSNLRLKDILEDEVDKKYYLDEERLDKVFQWKAHQRPLEKVLGKESICPTLTARGAGEYHSGMILLNEYFKDTTNVDKIISADFRYDEGLRIRKEEISPCLTCKTGGESLSSNPLIISKNEINVVGNYSPSNHNASRIVDIEGIAPTVMENHGTVTTVNTFKIRKLTPKECWRLMGFRDECFDRAKAEGISDSQLYKQAGNSIVVNVLYYIFLEIFKKYIDK